MNEWCMRIACWIPKVTNKHSEYAELIALPLPQWGYEDTSALRFKSVLFYFEIQWRIVLARLSPSAI